MGKVLVLGNQAVLFRNESLSNIKCSAPLPHQRNFGKTKFVPTPPRD